MDKLPPIELSVVMPVYNEEKMLAPSIDEALDALNKVSFSYEIILCNDASTDRSAEILAQYKKKYPELIKVITHSQNKGIMGALSSLFHEARGEYIFFNSSDSQYKTADCVPMMALRRQYDIVVGKRKKKLYNWRRHFSSWLFNALPRLFFGVNTFDAGSIKLYRKGVLCIPLISESPFREAERIIRAKLLGYRIGVIEVDHYQRRGGKATGAELRLLWHSFLDFIRCLKINVTPTSRLGPQAWSLQKR